MNWERLRPGLNTAREIAQSAVKQKNKILTVVGIVAGTALGGLEYKSLTDQISDLQDKLRTNVLITSELMAHDINNVGLFCEEEAHLQRLEGERNPWTDEDCQRRMDIEDAFWSKIISEGGK